MNFGDTSAISYLDFFLLGTFLPSLRASESPMAMACLRLFTVPPLSPLLVLRVPFLRRCMALFTFFLALRECFAQRGSLWFRQETLIPACCSLQPDDGN